MQMKDAVLCVDIGTSSLKAAYMADSPKSIAYARYTFTEKQPSKIASEWIVALKSCLEELKQKAPDTGIEAVCISGNGPTVVSEDGTTLMWYENPATTVKNTKSLFLPRLDGFRKLYQNQWYESPHIFSGPEYLIYLLTGTPLTILPEERYLEYYWTESELKEQGFSKEESKKLPPFVKPGSLAGKITEKAALQTGLLEGTLVFCGGPDFIVALLGTDTLETGRMCDRSGSSEGINLCTPVPIEGSSIRTLPSIIPGMWNAGVIIPDTGRRFAIYKEKVESVIGQKITHKNLVAQIVNYNEEDGISLLTPELRRQGMAVIHDVTHQLWAAVNILKSACQKAGIPEPACMTITGGQALNEIWTQVKCNALCLPITITECVDAELVGDNILTRVTLGYYDSLEEAAFCLVKKARVYMPETPADRR